MAKCSWSSALDEFAETLLTKFTSLTSGEPEDQLRAPFEQLLIDGGKSSGLTITPIGETLLAGGIGRPDYGIVCNGLLCGYLELKAPGKGADASRFKGHDKRQWERFSKLPNVIYSDSLEFGLYQEGELKKLVKISGDPAILGGQAIAGDDAKKVESLFSAFFQWEPIVPKSSKQLAQFLAPLCRMLRDDVLAALDSRVDAVETAARDWRRYLFPGADNSRFANDYAQTVAFSLLLARSNGCDTLFIDKAIESLTHANTLLSRALQVLTDPLVKEHLGVSLGMLQRVIDRVPPGTMSGGRRDPWLHFYEDFLSEYDPALRRDAGAYYTPVEVVQSQVRIVDDLLRKKLNKKHGFATGGVNVLDPAVGTGTYLLGIAEHALESVRQTEGPGAVPARADLLASHLFGFEIMVGPYAVSALRLTRMIEQYGGHPPADGVQVMLNNTLESPYEKIPELPLAYKAIGKEHQRAKRVKETVPVLVCIGNPPYDRHAAATDDNRDMTGGWVRWGETPEGNDSILQDFIKPVRLAGKGGSLKNLYNLYIYFWRWALWKTFEHDMAEGPGVVSYITANSFIDGDAFLGMRRHMRTVCDEIWIIDLGGEGRGTRQDENVFAIKTPVAITIAVRFGSPRKERPASVHYTKIDGSKSAKLETLEGLNSLEDLSFELCSEHWEAPFRPSGSGGYFNWPLLTDLMPWQHSGAQIKRSWPISPDSESLNLRWRHLLKATDRAAAFKETRDRKISTITSSLKENRQLAAIANIEPGTSAPAAVCYGFRSFDRQYLLLDNRIGDYLRPTLWQTHSDRQIYLTSIFTQALGLGPALTVSAVVPDMHYFSGRGAKDVIPLYRDYECEFPNLHPSLLTKLESLYELTVSPEDFVAYLYSVLSNPGFTVRYHEELESRELRIPITTNYDIFSRCVEIGKKLLFLHTYGERFSDNQDWPEDIIKSLKAVDHTKLPEEYAYDADRNILVVGDGEFGPVSPEVYNYEVSGLKVVQSWLGYRIKNRRGKKSSPLDEITPTGWHAEYTSELIKLLTLLTKSIEIQSEQAALLNEIAAEDTIDAAMLGDTPKDMKKAPKTMVKHTQDMLL